MPEPLLPEPPIPSTTTREEDRHSAGQRQINRVWEFTQAVIAVSVTASTLFVAGWQVVYGSGDMAAFLLLSNAFFLVIGFYFGRTNHQRVGGVDLGR